MALNGRQDVGWPKIRQIKVMICLPRLNGLPIQLRPSQTANRWRRFHRRCQKGSAAAANTDRRERRSLMLHGHPPPNRYGAEARKQQSWTHD